MLMELQSVLLDKEMAEVMKSGDSEAFIAKANSGTRQNVIISTDNIIMAEDLGSADGVPYTMILLKSGHQPACVLADMDYRSFANHVLNGNGIPSQVQSFAPDNIKTLSNIKKL